MNIYGLQKLSLLDYPGKVSATIFTGGCNLRCPFCHNASLVTHLSDVERVDNEELFDFLEKRSGILDGICVTGGEPLLQPDIYDFLRRVKSIGYSVKIDTNGCYPDKLRQIVGAGLVDYVAMDIKNSIESYPKTVGIPGFDVSAVQESVEFLLSGAVDYEFRTTVVKELHDSSDFVSISQWIKGAKRCYLQSFTDSGDIIGSQLSAYSKEQLEVFADILRQTVDNVELRGV